MEERRRTRREKWRKDGEYGEKSGGNTENTERKVEERENGKERRKMRMEDHLVTKTKRIRNDPQRRRRKGRKLLRNRRDREN